MSERTLNILSLLTLERSIWSAENIAAQMGVSISSAYRSIARLEALGFLSAAKPGQYVLGPAIIQYDRQIQLTDPLLSASRQVMEQLAAFAPPGSVVLLCRAFGETVLCVHQVQGAGPPGRASYERGRPMPLFRGAASGEVDAGRMGIAAPIFDEDRRAIGSQSYVIDTASYEERLVGRLTSIVVETAREIEQAMRKSD